jgi:hypothetical protein
VSLELSRGSNVGPTNRSIAEMDGNAQVFHSKHWSFDLSRGSHVGSTKLKTQTCSETQRLCHSSALSSARRRGGRVHCEAAPRRRLPDAAVRVPEHDKVQGGGLGMTARLLSTQKKSTRVNRHFRLLSKSVKVNCFKDCTVFEIIIFTDPEWGGRSPAEALQKRSRSIAEAQQKRGAQRTRS